MTDPLPSASYDGSAGSDGAFGYTPALQYTPGPGDPNYAPGLNYTPDPGDPNNTPGLNTPGLNYTPGPGDPNYVAELNYSPGPAAPAAAGLNYTPGPPGSAPAGDSAPSFAGQSLTGAPDSTGSTGLYPLYPASPFEGGGWKVASPPSAPVSAPNAGSFSVSLPPNVPMNSFTGAPEADPYTRQPMASSSDVSGTPASDPGLPQPTTGQTGYGSSGIPDSGLRQPPDAGNWYTLQQSGLFQRNQALSAQINFQLTYFDYLKGTTSYGNAVPSINQYASIIASFRPNLGLPGQIRLPPPGGTISTLPDDVTPASSIPDTPIWAGLTNTAFTDAQNNLLNSTLLNPSSYLAVLPVDAIAETIFSEAFEAGPAAGTGALRTGPAAAFPDVLGNVEGDPGVFSITTETTYLVRAGSPGVPGSWGDHLFESLAEARVYAQQLANSGERSIRNFSALSRVWPGGNQGNAVSTISIWKVPTGTKSIINVVGSQLEGGTVFRTPLLYPGGGPQVIIERGVRLELVGPELPVASP